MGTDTVGGGRGERGQRVDDPVVVIGTFRSASTLVAELLGSRPDCHYLGFELSKQISDATGVPFAAPGSNDRRCPGLTADDATRGQAARLRELLRHRAEQEAVERGSHLVIKNPHLWHRLEWLRALLPDARLVATVRDLRPAVASLKILWQRSLRQNGHLHYLPDEPDRCWDYVPSDQADGLPTQRTFPGGAVEVLAEFWLRANGRIARAAEAGALSAVVRHERTLADPGAEGARLQRALGFAPVRLEPPEPIDPSRQEEWRDRLTDDERRRLDRFLTRHRNEVRAIERVLAT